MRDCIAKTLLWLVLGGLIYYAIEGFWRIPTNGGWAHISMAFVGGLCFVLVGGINQVPRFYHLTMRAQALIGTMIVLAVEFSAGLILNIWLKMGIWDYSEMPLNLCGQICLLYGIFWFLLMPFAIWLEDRLNLMYFIYKGQGGKDAGEKGAAELYDYTLLGAYRELIFGK